MKLKWIYQTKYQTKTRNNSLFRAKGVKTYQYLFSLQSKQAARSGTLYNGWNYPIYPSYVSLTGDNGLSVNTVGNIVYEIYGMAIKDDVDSSSIWVGINSNLLITRTKTSLVVKKTHPMSNGNLSCEDVLFDFLGLGDFKAINDFSNLFGGVRFAINKGFYKDIEATSVIAQNDGWANLYNHNVYLNWHHHILNNRVLKIAYVTIANIFSLGRLELEVGFLPPTNNQIWAFRLAKLLAPIREYIAILLLECNNNFLRRSCCS